MAKKHYRAYKKQIEISSPKGTFVPNSKKNKLCALGFCILILVFLKGLLLGCLIKRND